MFYLYTGQIRNGKTISMVYDASTMNREGYTVYSNIELSFPYVKLTKKMIVEWEEKDLDIPPKSMFIIDEMHSMFDSRQSMNNIAFSYFITQLGKFGDDKQRGLTVLGTTQFFSQIDIRGRRVCKMLIECRKIDELDNEHVTILQTFRKNENLELRTVKRRVVKFDKKDFELYNTQEKIVRKK